MPETIQTTGNPPTETAIPKEQTATVPSDQTTKPEVDIVTKVSQYKPVKPETIPPAEPEIEKFDYKELDNLKSPDDARAWAFKAYKSMQRGWNQKFQELAELRKTFESRAKDQGWTPERIQELLKDPNFVQAAQSVAGTQTPEESYSSLNDAERKKLDDVAKYVREVQQQNAQLLKSQQDKELQGRYANYDPRAMDIITAEIMEKKRSITMEDVWKSYDYEEAVRRAYDLGRKDRDAEVIEKSKAISAEGVTTVASRDVPKREPNESSQAYFKRLAIRNLAMQAGK